MRNNIELSILNKFVKILKKHSNPIWAYDELEYLIFVKHVDLFNALNEDDQWEVRTVMIALKKIYK